MTIRLGYIDYLNCLPVYYGLETGRVRLDVELCRGTPAELNGRFIRGELDVTPISSIEYARNHRDCLILPGMSISADGTVGSILLFSKLPPERLGGRRVYLTSSSATSVVLTKILFAYHWRVSPDFAVVPPVLGDMLDAAGAAMLIGDDALLAADSLRSRGNHGLTVTDLGRAWKDLTGQMMVYALWTVRRDFALRNPAAVSEIASKLLLSKSLGQLHPEALHRFAARRRNLPDPLIRDYFRLIRHDFDSRYREGLNTFFQYALGIGELSEAPEIRVWGEEGEPHAGELTIQAAGHS